MKNKSAQHLGKMSVLSRHKGKTKKELSAYYSSLRKGKKLDKNKKETPSV